MKSNCRLLITVQWAAAATSLLWGCGSLSTKAAVPEVEETTVIDSEPVYGSAELEDNLLRETIVRDGITYYLVKREEISSATKARTEYGKATIVYYDVEYTDELPATGSVTVTDSVTGKEYVESLPRSGYTVTDGHWKDDFTFPVTIYSVDADYYMLGDTVIPRGAELNEYGDELISYLGLEGDCYEVHSVVLQGEPFEQNHEWVQRATAFGSRKTVDVAATYEGNILIPSEAFRFYRYLYSNKDPREKNMTCGVEEAAVNQSTEDEGGAVDMEGSIKNIWYQAAVLSIFLIPVIGLVVLLVLIRRRMKKEGRD